MRVERTQTLSGRIRVPGDKSISHRALLLGMLAEGESQVRGWLPAGDTLATLNCVRDLGVEVVRESETDLRIAGGGPSRPAKTLDCANAGTCMRLLAGLLAGQPFASVLDGSLQLRSRPMKRITEPLGAMGANIEAVDGRAPLTITPAELRPTAHMLDIASAQVKSALLLAGLTGGVEVTITEPGPSRDHTEKMLAAMGAPIIVEGRRVTLAAMDVSLQPVTINVPGDISSAAFVMVAAAALPGSDVTIENVGLNPTRTGIIDVLRAMGASITISESSLTGGEPVGDVRIQGGGLQGTLIQGDLVVRAIDELPAISAAALMANGIVEIRDAAELRVKEVDRIAVVAGELRKMGAHIEEKPDGMIIQGGTPLMGSSLSSHGDHRIGMMAAVAALFAEGESVIEGEACIADSFPGFAATMARLGAKIG